MYIGVQWHSVLSPLLRLDPALIRPGRVDMKVRIGHATRYQVQQMFQRFYPEQPADSAVRFAQSVAGEEEEGEGGRRVSMAQVQGYLMFYKSEPHLALENIHNIWTL